MDNKEDLTGRWLKCIKSHWIDGEGFNIKTGDYIQISSQYNTLVYIGKALLSVGRIENGEFELMPIGFNPNNIKKEFVLPDRWDLRITEESLVYVNNFRKTFKRDPLYIGEYEFIKGTGCGWGLRNKSSANEITLDQFKKYVLKINDDKPGINTESFKVEFKADFTCEPGIYITKNGNIYQWNGYSSDCYIGQKSVNSVTQDCFVIGDGIFKPMTDKKANFSERLWLNKCVEANRFIPKEEALKLDSNPLNYLTDNIVFPQKDTDKYEWDIMKIKYE